MQRISVKRGGRTSGTCTSGRKIGRRTAAGVVQGSAQGRRGSTWRSWVSWRHFWSSGRRQETWPFQVMLNHRWLICQLVTASLTPLLPARNTVSQPAKFMLRPPPHPHPHRRAGPGGRGRGWIRLRSGCSRQWRIFVNLVYSGFEYRAKEITGRL